jgi:hypothetical protein
MCVQCKRTYVCQDYIVRPIYNVNDVVTYYLYIYFLYGPSNCSRPYSIAFIQLETNMETTISNNIIMLRCIDTYSSTV